MLGRQPAEDGFPAAVSFRSVAAVRNLDLVPVQVTPIIKFSQDGSVQAITLDPLTLGVGESRILDFVEEQKAGRFPWDLHQASLDLVPGNAQGRIVGELFNFSDRNGGYVIGPTLTSYPTRGTGSIWRIDGTFQTTIMVENTAVERDAVSLKLFYDRGAYNKTFAVPAGGFVKINVRELQQNAVPDDDGHLLLGTSGILTLAGNNNTRSKLTFDKIIHDADQADYVGYRPNGCDYLTSIGLFVDISGGQNPAPVIAQYFWSISGEIDQPASGTVSGNTSLVQISSSSNGDMATITPSDSQSEVIGLGGPVTTASDCGACSYANFTPAGSFTVPPKPGFVKVVSANTAIACLGQGCEAQVQYQVLDVNGTPLRLPGMAVLEFTSVSSSCGPGDWKNASKWFTDANGNLMGLDYIHICGTGDCRITITQTFTVNGYPVLIMASNGITTGTKNVITISISNGQSSCPTIVITP